MGRLGRRALSQAFFVVGVALVTLLAVLALDLVTRTPASAQPGDVQQFQFENYTSVAASDLHVEFAGTGGNIQDAQIDLQPLECQESPHTVETELNMVWITWASPCVQPQGHDPPHIIEISVSGPFPGPIEPVSVVWTLNGSPIATPTPAPTPTPTPTPTPSATPTATATVTEDGGEETPTVATQTPSPTPMPCPTAATLLQNQTVIDAINDAWNDSDAGDQNNRHEEGGWIIFNQSTGAIRVQRWPTGGGSTINPNAANLNANEKVCAEFHTHPNPPVDESATKWEQGPSAGDIAAANAGKMPGIVRNAAGTQTYGNFDPAQ